MTSMDNLKNQTERIETCMPLIRESITAKGGTLATSIETVSDCITSIPSGGTITKVEMRGDYLMNSRSQSDFEVLSKIAKPTSLFEFADNNTNITSIPSDFDVSKIYGTSFSDPNGKCNNAFYGCSNLTGIIDMSGAQPTWINSMFYNCSKLEGVINFNLNNIKAASISSNIFPKNSLFHKLTFVWTGTQSQFPFLFDLTGDKFNRQEMVDMFNSLPNIFISSSNRNITITNCTCVTDGTLTNEDKLICTNKGYTLTV